MRGPTQTLYYRVRRCSRPLCSSQRTTRHRPPDPTSPRPPQGTQRYEMQTGPAEISQHAPPGRPALSGPNSVPPTGSPRPPRSPRHPAGCRRTRSSRSHRPNWSAFHPRAPPHTPRRPFTDERPITVWARPCTTGTKPGGEVLLRKEVIQPHLPVRLPCYDFVPIADPAFDGSLPQRGWATGFGRYRLS